MAEVPLRGPAAPQGLLREARPQRPEPQLLEKYPEHFEYSELDLLLTLCSARWRTGRLPALWTCGLRLEMNGTQSVLAAGDG
ncbi:hypothetical protein CapIbe_014466 [Capra ibex]